MQRRDFNKIAGVFAASAILPTLAQAAEKSAPKAMARNKELAKIAHLALVCAENGQTCIAHCNMMMENGDKSLAECQRSVMNMVAICKATAEIANYGTASGKSLKAILNGCSEMCKACEEVCKKHASHHAECKACMESCKDCAQACDAFTA